MNNQEALYLVTKQLADKWAENAEDNISKKLDEILSDRLDEFVLRVCGFEVQLAMLGRSDRRWWRIDHCNGRSGNSPIGAALTSQLSERLVEAFSQVSLTTEEKASLQQEARKLYLQKYRAAINSAVQSKAQKDAMEYVAKTMSNALDGAAESVRLRLMESNT